jgi:photosystem II stability/assembly factor-like uncharacterized protein
VENYVGGKWTKKQVQAGMLLDSAITPSGNTIATSMWTVFLSKDHGETYTTVEGLGGLSQSANVWGDNQENFALVGSWAVSDPNSKVPTSISGVAYSTDAGETWSLSANVPAGMVRYGAFPTTNTWYISSGMWGESALKSSKKGKFALSERFEIGAVNELKSTGNTSETGWFGAVSKTTDGGKTWTQVFQTDLEKDTLYFNGISCSSESHCAVVAEGYDEQGQYKTVGYVTFDGGVTWTASLTTGDVGLMQIKFISELEGWAAGTSKQGRNLYGQFYHTNDGGKTWALQQSLQNCFAIDMDFAMNKGYAACSSSSGASCSVAVYA